MLISQFSEETV